MSNEPNLHAHPIDARDVEASPEGGTLDEILRPLPAALTSLIVHLILLICLAVLSWQIETDEPLVIEVTQVEPQQDAPMEPLVIEPVEMETEAEVPTLTEVDVLSTPISIESDLVTPELDTGVLASVSMKNYSPGFASRIIDAQRNGIEIVIVFDSTGSMGPEIEAVKKQIRQIGDAVVAKIPEARFSLTTYRDRNDAYVVRGTKLDKDVSRMHQFAGSVYPGGGGDRPEAVQLGMRWAIHTNDYRESAQKVMLIFGDAPPHQADLEECIELAERFRDYGKGRVFTVTCRNGTVLPEFYAIARAGAGDAYLMHQSDRLMEDLLVIAFGAEHRAQVLRFFEIEDREVPRRFRKSTRRRRSIK